MTDMNTGMPFYWTGVNPVNVVPPNQALQNNLAQNTAMNQASSQQVTNNSAAIGANANTFDPFRQSGGFGTMTDYYSNLGAAYGRGTGGFGGQNINDRQALSNWGGGLFDTDAYRRDNPDVAAAGVDPTAHWFDFGAKEGRNARTFNPWQYQQQNPDVWSSGADPYQHYKQYGITEGRTGAWSDYNPTDYLSLNPDVAASGMDPTAHWFEFGEKEGRKGSLSPLDSYQGSGFDAFDPNIYSGSHPTAGFGQQPTASTPKPDWGDLWKERGPYNRSSQSSANTGRDDLAAEYYAANRDVYDAARGSGQNFTDYALNHLNTYGMDEGRGFFDEQGYLERNPDVAASGMDPTAHWFQFGQNEGRDATTGTFDPTSYYLANTDVANANMDALQHYLTYGQNEGREGGWEWSSRNKGSAYEMLPHAPGMEGNDAKLAAQRASYRDLLANDPAKRLQVAKIMHRELQNDPEGRQGIAEAMMNRYYSRQIDPLNLKYYPQRKAEYNAQADAKLMANPDLLNQVYGELDRALGGSNLSSWATDWASAPYSQTNSRPYQTPTWTSKANEEFFRKDIFNTHTGLGAARQIQDWLNLVRSAAPY